MKKFFSFTIAIFLLISMVGLVGCNGLWDFDDDDDVTVMPVKFNFKGAVGLGGPLAPGAVPSIRGALSAASYVDAIVNVYAESDKAGTNDLSDGSITVDATGAFNVDFTALNGTAFYIKISKTGLPTLYRFFGAKTSTEMETAYGTTATAAEVNEKTTVVGMIIVQNPDLKYGTDIDESDSAVFAGGTGLAVDFQTFLGSYDPNNPTTYTPTVKVDTVIIDQTGPISLEFGKTQSLTATVNPAYATNKTVTWRSDNASVATVDSAGVVTAGTTEGTANIIATADGVDSTAVVVTVTAAPVAVTGVTLNKATTSLTVGGYETLIAKVEPKNATTQTVTWKSSNTSVATVDSNGKVTAVAAGQATITVTTTDGNKTATCVVTVTAAVTEVATVTFDSAVSGVFDNQLKFEITGHPSSFTTTETTVAYEGGSFKYVLSSALSADATTRDGVPTLVLVTNDANPTSPKTMSDFSQLTFSPAIPVGSTVKVKNGATVVATSNNIPAN